MGHLLGLHRKEGDEREENDYYATHPSAIPPLLKVLGWTGGGKIIRENSCGQGHLSEPLIEAGHRVIASDLIDRGYGVHGVDFLQPNWLDTLHQYDAVIMNPPYKHAQEFINKSLRIAPVVASFLRITFLESQTRKEFFKENPPAIVAVFSNRMRSAKNGDFSNIGSGVVCYAWFIWHRGFKGDPIIKFI